MRSIYLGIVNNNSKAFEICYSCTCSIASWLLCLTNTLQIQIQNTYDTIVCVCVCLLCDRFSMDFLDFYQSIKCDLLTLTCTHVM